MGETKPVLLCCGVLRHEVRWLVEERAWDVEVECLDSALHVSFEKLYIAVGDALAAIGQRPTVLVYGACHPRIDALLAGRPAVRLEASNCCEMLLGPQRFHQGLELGSFFMLREWAAHWQEFLLPALGDLRGMRLIFSSCHKSIVGLRTPGSLEFSEQAEAISLAVGLPWRMEDTGLEYLSGLIEGALARATKAAHGL